MHRSVKRFIYGVFYITLFVFIIWFFYHVQLKTAPTCFDKILNQEEIQIDCGGTCQACEVLGVKPIKLVGPVRVFGSNSQRTVFLAEAINQNIGEAATQAPYKFLVYDNYGRLVEEILGTESFYPSQKKYIYTANVRTSYRIITKVDLEFRKPTWQNAKEILKPNLVLGEDFATQIEGGAPRVSGKIKNQGSLLARDIKIIAILSDQFGIELFASETLIPTLLGFEEKSFVVSFPVDSNLAGQVDQSLTQVFFSSR